MNLITRIALFFIIIYLLAVVPAGYFWIQMVSKQAESVETEEVYNEFWGLKIGLAESKLVRDGLIALGLGLGITLILAAILGHSLRKPLRQIKMAVESVISGQNGPLKPKGASEVKTLINSFNQMVSSVKQHQESLKKHQHREGWQEAAWALAHEMINFLMPIQLSIDRIGKKAISCQDEIEVIGQEIERLKGLTNNLLSLGSPYELNLLPKQILPVVMNSLSACQVTQKTKFKLAYQKGNIHVMADEEALKRAFINLIENGIESMEEIGRFQIKISSDEENVMVEFVDSGCGISAEALGSIFEPHYSKKREGVGLGLTVSQQIISGHGGRIEVESEPGEGSNFKVILPGLGKA